MPPCKVADRAELPPPSPRGDQSHPGIDRTGTAGDCRASRSTRVHCAMRTSTTDLLDQLVHRARMRGCTDARGSAARGPSVRAQALLVL